MCLTRCVLQITVGFMFVGHTHCKLDQMFSRFCIAINKAYLTGTYDAMDDLIRQSYSPNPLMVKMEETTDVTAWLRVTKAHPYLERVNGLNPRRSDKMEHEKAHEFKFFKDEDGVTKMNFKLTQKDARWLPSEEGKDMWLGAERPGGVTCDTDRWWEKIDPPQRAAPAPIDLEEIEKGLKKAKTFLPPAVNAWWKIWLRNQKQADRYVEEHGVPTHSRTWAAFMERVGNELRGNTWRGPGWGGDEGSDVTDDEDVKMYQGDDVDGGAGAESPPRTPPREAPSRGRRSGRAQGPAAPPPERGGNTSVETSPNMYYVPTADESELPQEPAQAKGRRRSTRVQDKLAAMSGAEVDEAKCEFCHNS
jgi:hypothetical protein